MVAETNKNQKEIKLNKQQQQKDGQEEAVERDA